MLKTNATYFNLSTSWRRNFPADTGIFFVVAYVLYHVYLKLVSKGEKNLIFRNRLEQLFSIAGSIQTSKPWIHLNLNRTSHRPYTTPEIEHT